MEITDFTLALTLSQKCQLSALTGVVAHVVYFRRGCRDLQAFDILVGHILALALLAYAEVALSETTGAGVLSSLAEYSCYLAGLFSSILLYRVFFHPLRRIPGPFLARFTALYGPCNKDERGHWVKDEYFRKYGPVVRIGPNSVAVCSVDVIPAVHGGQSRCHKPSVYDINDYRGAHDVDSLVDKAQHRSRRAIWDRMFSVRALLSYEPRVCRTIRDWMRKIDSLAGDGDGGSTLDVTKWAGLLALENMGRVGFGREMGAIEKVDDIPLLTLMSSLFHVGSFFAGWWWPLVIFKRLGVEGDIARFNAILVEMVEERLREEADGKEKPQDMVSYLIEDYKQEKPRSLTTIHHLLADSRVVIMGATDTISATLTSIFYYLAKFPRYQAELHAALSPLWGKTRPGEFADSDVSQVAILQAFVQECLRLHAPTGNNSPRTVGPGGLNLEGYHLPEGIVIFPPVYSIQRSSRYFENPEQFIPERWTTRPELTHDRRAYHPFLTGPFNCVGRNFALMTCRLVVAHTVCKYTFKFAPGEDGTRFHTESKDWIILRPAPVELTFTARTSSEA